MEPHARIRRRIGAAQGAAEMVAQQDLVAEVEAQPQLAFEFLALDRDRGAKRLAMDIRFLLRAGRAPGMGQADASPPRKATKAASALPLQPNR